jgi:hypothetical protein
MEALWDGTTAGHSSCVVLAALGIKARDRSHYQSHIF